MEERHEEETSRNIGLLVAGFALGAITGAILGLLFAPKSGRELRADLREKGGEYYGLAKEKIKEGYGASKEKLGEAYERVKSAVQSAAKGVKERLSKEEEQKEKAEEAD